MASYATRLLLALTLTVLSAACGTSSRPATDIGATSAPGEKLANSCFAMRTAAGKFVIAAGNGYRGDGSDAASAPAFYFKPSGLGTYLPQDQDGKLLSAHGIDAIGRDDVPGPRTEWTLRGDSTGPLAIVSTATGRKLSAPSSSALVQTDVDTGGADSQFALDAREGCTPFPEAEVGASGMPFAGTNHDGTVRGFVDLHLHIAAELRAGGEVIYGEPFDRFGIAQALGRDADVHGPDGSLDITGNLLRSGLPVGTHDTHGWPTFAGWPVSDTLTHQQTYYVWLQRAWMAGERLVVAQTVEDEPLCKIEPLRAHSCDETATVALEVAQLRAMQDYVDAQSGGPGRGWFRLVYDPQEARRVIERGQMAVVIGVESSDPFGCSELLGLPQCTRADIDRGVELFWNLGVRSVFPAHWVDNAFAGAALEGGSKGLFIGAMEVAQTGHPFLTGPCPDPVQGEADPVGPKVCNSKGLTDLGEYLIQKLIERHMLIEVDHMSEVARERVLTIAEAQHYPLVSSHTNTGGTWSETELDRLYALGGIGTARVDQAPAFAETVLRLQKHRSDRYFFGVGFGTDTGGFASLPAPRSDVKKSPVTYPFTSFLGDVGFERERSGARVYDLNDDGVAHYGLIADLVADLQQHGDAAALDSLFRSAEAYLQMWQRAVDLP